MPVAAAAPGIRFEFADAPRAPREIRTDIVGFVGFTERGPFHRATRIESWHEFESVFGGFGVNGFLPHAVDGFYSNGGLTCYVVRVLVPPGDRGIATPARHASISLQLVRNAGPSGSVRLIASSAGSWGNSIAVVVEPRVMRSRFGDTFRFTMIVRHGDSSWRLVDCSLDPADARYFPTVLDETPDLPVRLDAQHTGDQDEESALNTPWSGVPRTPPVAALEAGPPDDPFRLVATQSTLSGGLDGLAGVTLEHLRGNEYDQAKCRWGLLALTDIDEVALVAVPDGAPFPREPEPEPRPRPVDCSTLDFPATPQPFVNADAREYPPQWTEAEMADVGYSAIRFCQRRRDCVALLDTPPGLQTVQQVEEYRSAFDSSFAGIYWPWLLVERNPRGPSRGFGRPPSPDYGSLQPPLSDMRLDPIGLREPATTSGAGKMIAVPPSGIVAGLTAAADNLVGPHRTPAGQTARRAIAVTTVVSDDDHGTLNAHGINVLRERVGRGVVLEGARSLDAEQRPGNPWRHLNVRRVLLAIMEVIDERTQWAVFEPNDQSLWADLGDVLRGFLTERWRRGWLSGLRPQQAFYVVCDRSTNPQESVDLGLVVARIGLRFPPPIEWIVVRIGRSNTGVEVLDVDRA